MKIDRESLKSDLRVTYHMLTMVSHDYSGTLVNGYLSVDTVHLKTLTVEVVYHQVTLCTFYFTETTINSVCTWQRMIIYSTMFS